MRNTETMQQVMDRPSTYINKTHDEEKGTITYVEEAPGVARNPELQALLDREPTKLPRVVVKCDRITGMWNLFRGGRPYKQLRAAVLINVSFSCEWNEGRSPGCGFRKDGQYMGYAAGDLLPIATPVTVPAEGVVHLRFDVEDGHFYNSATGEMLSGAGYLILKEGCSSEYVQAQAIGPESKAKTKAPRRRKAKA
jgi:hypothetical protein